jgi:hypothetical protein
MVPPKLPRYVPGITPVRIWGGFPVHRIAGDTYFAEILKIDCASVPFVKRK